MPYDLIFGQRGKRSILGSDEPNVWTPSAILAERHRIINVFDTVNLEASQAVATGKLSPDEWNQWSRIYKSSHDFLTTASNLWGSNANVARRHEDLALKWHEFIASKGGQVIGPKNPGRAPDSKPGFDNWTLALIVGGIASTAVLVKAVRAK
jgi:hypothetical protein